MKRYEREFAKMAGETQEDAMTMWTSWGREGMQKGLQQGKEELVVRQINRRFGAVSSQITARLDTLPAEQLDELGVALLDFASLADLETWLDRH